MIRDLKQEMAKLGINESEFALPPTASQPLPTSSQSSKASLPHPSHAATLNHHATATLQPQGTDSQAGPRTGPALFAVTGKDTRDNPHSSAAAAPGIVRGVVKSVTGGEEGDEGGCEEDEDEWARGFLDLADLAAVTNAAPTAAVITSPAATTQSPSSTHQPSKPDTTTVADGHVGLLHVASSSSVSIAQETATSSSNAGASLHARSPSPTTSSDPIHDSNPSADDATMDPAPTAPACASATIIPALIPPPPSTELEDEPPAWDLFDAGGDGTSEPPPGAAPVTAAAAAAAASRNAAALRRLMKVAASKGGGRPPPPSEPPKVPRTFLSQHCQRVSWPQPRFERLPDVGAEGGFRYSAILDLGPSK